MNNIIYKDIVLYSIPSYNAYIGNQSCIYKMIVYNNGSYIIYSRGYGNGQDITSLYNEIKKTFDNDITRETWITNIYYQYDCEFNNDINSECLNDIKQYFNIHQHNNIQLILKYYHKYQNSELEKIKLLKNKNIELLEKKIIIYHNFNKLIQEKYILEKNKNIDDFNKLIQENYDLEKKYSKLENKCNLIDSYLIKQYYRIKYISNRHDILIDDYNDLNKNYNKLIDEYNELLDENNNDNCILEEIKNKLIHRLIEINEQKHSNYSFFKKDNNNEIYPIIQNYNDNKKLNNKLIVSDSSNNKINNNKMWGSKKTQSNYSEFFKGVNIFEKMVNSIYRQFKNTLFELFSEEDIKEYDLPKVIVIGNESTGKSSLLENITKCQLFPRDNKLCTKCPIRVKLNNGPSKYYVVYPGKMINVNNKNEIYPIIQKYMMELPNDYISGQEITISITDIDMPNFEFYDLPGIRTYPLETAETTTKLCKKYLLDKNSIVLCVVPATTTRLTSCQSIALISEMKMEENTILALTMTDRLQPENIEELLIKRIIQTSDEINGLNFAGYISIVNRVHLDNCSLEDNDKHEQKWFYDNIISGIPEEYKIYEEKIKENITIANLISKMDDLYNKFIHTNWKPRILSSIQDKITDLNNKYNDLGEEITDPAIINNKFNQYIKDKLLEINSNDDILYNDESEEDNESKKYKSEGDNSDSDIKEFEYNSDSDIEEIEIKESFNIYHYFEKYNILNRISSLTIVDRKYLTMDLLHNLPNIIKLYTSQIDITFINNIIDEYFSNSNIIIKNMDRFKYASNKITKFYNNKLTKLLLENEYKFLEYLKSFIVDKYFMILIDKVKKQMSSNIYENFVPFDISQVLFELFTIYIIYPLSQIKIKLKLSDLLEDESYIQKRINLRENIIKVESHYKQINLL